MAALAKLTRISVKLVDLQPSIIYTTARCASRKMGDYKPGPLPTTPEERRKAAEKYGLPLSKYETYPDDGMGYGDYPKLPMVSGEARDDYYPWDIPPLKRNFGEPIHALESMIDETRYNVSHKHRYPMWLMTLTFFGTLAGFTVVYLIFENPRLKLYPPAMAKQLPANGRANYDFPLCQSDAILPKHH